MRKWHWIGIITALALFILADCISQGTVFGDFGPWKQAQKVSLKVHIKWAKWRYLSQNERLLKELEKNLAHAGDSDFTRALNSIPSVTKQCSGFKWNFKLCYKIAKDRICKTHDTEAALKQVIGRTILDPCDRGHAAILQELSRFLHQIRENDNNFRAELAQIIQDSKYFENDLKARDQFQADVSKLITKIQEQAVAQTVNAVGIMIEAICIRQSVAMAVRVCGHVASKLAAAGTAAAVSAAADGPLPVGDVIGVAVLILSAGWCAYDVYQLKVIMPREMDKCLRQSIAKYRDDSRQQAMGIARKQLAFYENSMKKITENL